jgi:hypothetical protein
VETVTSYDSLEADQLEVLLPVGALLGERLPTEADLFGWEFVNLRE